MAHSLPCPFFLFIALILFTLSTSAHNTGNINVGSSLTATENSKPWSSPSGEFTFGFQRLQSDRNLFALSIWLDKIPDKTIVWYERGSYPVPRGSKLELNARDGLVLRHPQGRLLYNTTGLADEVAFAFMNDTGNFVLLRSDSSFLWESFRHPTDTILPTQTLEINDRLISRKTQTDFSPGKFYASMNSDGNFVFNTKSMPSNLNFDDEYYNSQTSDLNASNSGFRVVFSESASIFILRRNGQQQLLSLQSNHSPPSDVYYRATLDLDGVFTLYYHPKKFGSNPQWTAARSWPNNICINMTGDKGSGACGYNSVCRLVNQRPVCECLQGYSLADPNNAYGDCKPNYNMQNCDQVKKGSADDEYELLKITDIDWPHNDYQQISPSTEKQCRNACLKDCFCAAAIYREKRNSCWKKKLPLSNGRVDTTLTSKAFIKSRKESNVSEACYKCHHGGGQCHVNRKNEFQCLKANRAFKKIALIGSLTLTSTSIFLFLFILRKHRLLALKEKSAREKEIELFLKKNGSLAPVRYKYSKIKKMTNSFSEKLGNGGYGSVYKGKLPNGLPVAVKILNESKGNGEEFMNEVASISRTSHINIVTLMGYCFEGSKRALIYDFMPNGSLEKFIQNTTSSPAEGGLGWQKLFEIALGIARGLEYLHQGCNMRILHFDIKPHNILLDKDFNPKISDFGLAKLCPNRSSIVSMLGARGTIGYIAPEVFSRSFGEVSYKSDVYSYGMMVLEIAGGRKNVDPRDDSTSDNYFPQYIYKQLEMDVERHDGIMNEDEGQFAKRKLMIVGLWCIQTNPKDRPSMSKVLDMLDGKIEPLQVPPKPYLSSPPTSAPIFSTFDESNVMFSGICIT